MNTTENLGLRKPERDEQYKLDDWNYNSDKIDEFAGTVNTALAGKASTADLTAAIAALDVASAGGSGKYIAAIEETDGKISTTEGTIDSTPTASSTNPVTSGGVQSPLAELIDSGAKNVLDFDSLNRTTHYGATFTVNGDGTITVNMEAASENTASVVLKLGGANVIVNALCNGRHVISGCPQNSSGVTLRAMYGSTSLAVDSGDGVVIPEYTGSNDVVIAILISKNHTVDNLIVKPMLCTKTAWDISQKYVPYCPSMAELYAMIQALQSGTRSAPAALTQAEPEEPEQEEMR